MRIGTGGGDDRILVLGRRRRRCRESGINLRVIRLVLCIRIGVVPVLGGVGVCRRGERWYRFRRALDGLWLVFSIVLIQFRLRGADLGFQRR